MAIGPSGDIAIQGGGGGSSPVTGGDLTEVTSSVLTITGGSGAVLVPSTTIEVAQASAGQAGYLSATDWTTFNAKMDNPMTILGDIIYGETAGVPTALPGNTTGQFKVLTSIGSAGAATAPSWEALPVAGLLTYFFIDTASDIGGAYKQAVKIGNYTPAAKSTLTTNNVVVGTYVGTFATNANVPGLTVIPDGLFHIHMHASRNLGTPLGILAEVYIRTSGGTETLLLTSHEEMLNTTEEGFEFNGVLTDPVSISSTDRLVIKFKVSTATGAARSVNLYYDGIGANETYSRLEAPSPAVDASNFVPSTRIVATTAPLTGGGDLSADRTLVIPKSTAAVDGYLAATDFVSFSERGYVGSVKLTGPITYYVRTDGNDSNDGSANDAAHAWLTLQHAIDYVNNYVYLNSNNVTIQVGDGTYTGAVLSQGDPPGAGSVTIQGNSGNHNAVILTNSTGTGAVAFQGTKKWNLKNLQLASTGSCAYALYAFNYAIVGLNGVNFGAAITAHMIANQYASISIGGAYTIAGDAPYHMLARLQGTLLAGVAITVTGRTFSAVFIDSNHAGVISLEGASWTGTFTGQRYNINGLSLLWTAGQATTWIPGSVVGATGSGGVYA